MMSYLFPVALRGIGSLNIESFSSYIQRLALAHGVTIGKLLSYAYEKYAEDHSEFRKDTPMFISRGDLSIYVRPNKTTKETVKVLEYVTGNPNIRRSTFLSLHDALDRSVGVFSAHVRWCPACMAEFERQGDTGYFKLIWHLRSLKHCPDHGLRLVDKCAHCGRHQGIYGSRNELVKCQKCGKSLGDMPSYPCVANSWEVEAPDLMSLVETISKSNEIVFPREGVRKVVSYLFDKAWKNSEELEFWSVIPKELCICIDTGTKPMTLTIARRIAYKLGMSLTDLLSGSTDMYTELLDLSWSENLPIDIKPKKRRKFHDRDKVHEDVNKTLEGYKKSYPPPLKQVAKEVGVSTGCLRYHFESLANKIVKDHKQWLENERLKKHREARACALEYFHENGITKSKNAAYKVIPKKTGLPKLILKEEIEEVYKMLFLEELL